MEIRRANIIINHSGGNSGERSQNYKISLPTKWMQTLGIAKGDNGVEISFDGEQIVIKRSLGVAEFVKRSLNMGHNVKQLNYYNENELCSCIYADFTDRLVKVKNENKPNILLAFGSNTMPLWNDFMLFLEDRCIPRSVDGIKYYLNELGLCEYDPLEIIKHTKGRMSEDNQWLEVIDLK